MSTERIDIIVNDKGTRTVSRNIDQLATSAGGADTAVRLLNRTLALIGGGVAVRQLTNLVDAYTNMQNRLRIVTTSTKNLGAVTDQLFAIANRTRTSFQDTANLYARLAMNQDSLGVSQQQLLTFSERLGQAVQLSGASAREASAGIIQLTQGMAAGVLRGQDLRSVMEQIPMVADVIAQHLGVTRGELRNLGAQGKITANDIIQAFLQADDLTAKFATTVPTLGQAFTVLENKVEELIGKFNQETGASESVARGMIDLANNINTVVRAVVDMSAAIAVLAGPAVLGLLIRNLQLLWTTMRKNPFILFAAVIVGLITDMVIFNQGVDDSLDKMQKGATMAGRLAGAWAGVKAYIETAWEDFPNWLANLFLDAVNGAIKTLGKFVNWVGDSLGDLFNVKNGHVDLTDWLVGKPERFAKAGTDAATAFHDAYMKVVTQTAVSTKGTSGDIGTTHGTAITSPNAAQLKAAQKLARQLKQVEHTADPAGAAVQRYSDAQNTLNAAVAAGLIPQSRAIQLSAMLFTAMQKQMLPVKDYTDELSRQNDMLKLNSNQREKQEALFQLAKSLNRDLTDEEKNTVAYLLQQNDALKAQADLYDQIRGPQETYERTMNALNALLDKGRISQQQYFEAVLDAQSTLLDTVHTVQGGVASGLNEIVKTFTDSSGIIKQAMTDAFQGMEDSLVDFVATGKASVSDLVNSIVSDLARIAIRQAVTGPLASALGEVLGSIMPGAAASVNMVGSVGSSLTAATWMPGRAGGGVTASNAAYRVNERGVPEVWSNGSQDFLLTGSQQGNVTPIEPSSGSSGVVVVAPKVNIYNNASASVKTQQRQGADGQPELDVIIDQIESSMATGIRSGQSPMVGAIGSKFGLTPQPGGR